MVLMATRAQALARRQRYVTPSGAVTHVSTYIGTNKMELLAQGRSGDAAEAGPMAYLVEQAAGSTVEPHYHQVEQFQLFVGGSGRIGTHALAGVTVHYAGPFSPYGPIVAGPEGVHYVTLRRAWDPGAQWMPQAAQKLRSIEGRRQVAWTSQPVELHTEPPAEGQVACLDVVAPAAGGAGARFLRASEGAAPDAADNGAHDRFWYVLAGSLRAEDGELGAGSCIYLPQGERASRLLAGRSGVQLVQLQFPQR